MTIRFYKENGVLVREDKDVAKMFYTKDTKRIVCMTSTGFVHIDCKDFDWMELWEK